MKQGQKAAALWVCAVVVLSALSLAAGGGGPSSGVVAGWIFTALALLFALYLRLKVIPRFTYEPGRLQLALETLTACFIPRPKPQKAPRRAGYGTAKPKGSGVKDRLKRLPGAVGAWAAANRAALLIWLSLIAVLFAGARVTGRAGGHGDVQELMRDAVLHDTLRVSLFSLKEVNPALIAAMTVSAVLLAFALLIRLLVIPRFTDVPGKLQMLLETVVGLLDNMAGARADQEATFIGGYVFAAGVYIFTGTLFELFGLQAVAVNGHSVALPAPLSDVNAAIAMGCLSYLVILGGGLVRRGGRGAGAALKEFSLPISMSFRLFGALLSGLLVTELVYHYLALSYVLPVIVGVMFTLLHALVQSYVLTMLVGMYYREVTEEAE